MSEIRVNTVVDEGGTGSPILTYGCEVPVGYGITGAGGVNVSGACTASAGFVGNITGNASGTAGGLSGSPNITINNLVGVAATFSGVVTYEDVTNVDSVGIVTARGGFEIGAAGVGGTITSVGNAEFAGIVTATSFSGDGSSLSGMVNTGKAIAMSMIFG
jgi:hypothetical protein